MTEKTEKDGGKATNKPEENEQHAQSWGQMWEKSGETDTGTDEVMFSHAPGVLGTSPGTHLNTPGPALLGRSSHNPSLPPSFRGFLQSVRALRPYHFVGADCTKSLKFHQKFTIKVAWKQGKQPTSVLLTKNARRDYYTFHLNLIKIWNLIKICLNKPQVFLWCSIIAYCIPSGWALLFLSVSKRKKCANMRI